MEDLNIMVVISTFGGGSDGAVVRRNFSTSTSRGDGRGRGSEGDVVGEGEVY